MLPSFREATRVMSDRQPIALIGHDGLELGAGQGDLPVYHLDECRQTIDKEVKARFPSIGVNDRRRCLIFEATDHRRCVKFAHALFICGKTIRS